MCCIDWLIDLTDYFACDSLIYFVFYIGWLIDLCVNLLVGWLLFCEPYWLCVDFID